MKKYEVYLSNIIASRVSHLSNKYHLKSDIIFLEAMPSKELPQINYETTWYLVSNDYFNEIENKMLSIIYKNIPVIYKEYDLLNQEVKEYFKELKGEGNGF